MVDAEFENRNEQMVRAMAGDARLAELSQAWFEQSYPYEYSYHFTWGGLPIIQYPQDIVALQEIIWRTRPDVIVETGIARGGSLVFYASLLEMIGIDGEVVGIDIDIRSPNRSALESHPLSHRIRLLEGSSTDPSVLEQVRRHIERRSRVMVVLDSNHTHEHVAEELRLYAPLVSPGSYLVVFDTIVDLMPPGTYDDRPWDRGNSPMTAVREFLDMTDDFVIDRGLSDKLLITAAPDGYLRRLG